MIRLNKLWWSEESGKTNMKIGAFAFVLLASLLNFSLSIGSQSVPSILIQ